jgi:hypothetical protein
MEECCGHTSVEIIPGNNCDFRTYLAKRVRAKLDHAQRCSFLIMEQSCGSLAVEIFSENHCDFRTYLPKRARAQSSACAEVQYPDYGTEL